MTPRVRFLGRLDGDYVDADAAPDPSGSVPGRPWTWLRQVHGADVVTVTRPGEHVGSSADAAVTIHPGCALLVRTADCAPVALLAAESVGLAHSGWRGLRAGVIEATVARMRALGATDVEAVVGPCISADAYDFDGPELAALVDRYGPTLASRSARGAAALDLRAGVFAAVAAAGARTGDGSVPCTAGEPERWFSHRARGDTGRQATFVWLEE